MSSGPEDGTAVDNAIERVAFAKSGEEPRPGRIGKRVLKREIEIGVLENHRAESTPPEVVDQSIQPAGVLCDSE